jgi:hypothetical protein
LAVRGGRTLARFEARSVGFALATALTITAYTLVDGSGARLAGSALQYSAWLFVLSGVAMALYGLGHGGYTIVRAAVANWAPGSRRRGPVDSRLWHRHLGHDGGTHRAHRRAASCLRRSLASPYCASRCCRHASSRL